VVSQSNQSRQYLEIGAGTGVFTSAIVKKMGPNDHLDIVEINPEFCKQLKDRYQKDRRVRVISQSILEFQTQRRYDAVISGLPLTVFKEEQANKIQNLYHLLVKNRGYISYFEYALI